MSQNQTSNETKVLPLQGFYLEAVFDRLITKVKKNKDGQDYNVYEVGVIVRTEESTSLYVLKTKNPDKWRSTRSGTPINVRVIPRAFKDFLYFTLID